MGRYALDQKFELEAEWHVPLHPEVEPKQGTLTYEPGRYIWIEFGILGALTNRSFRTIGQYPEAAYDIIKGQAKSGESILALDSSTFGFSKFSPRAILISDNPIDWEKTEDIRFRRISTHFTHLEEWWSAPPFKLEEHELSQNEIHSKEIVVRYALPRAVEITISSPALPDLAVRLVPHLVSSRSWPGKVLLEHQIRCEITADTAQPLKLLFDQLQHLQDLLTLLIGEPVRKLDISATSEEDQIFHVLHAVPAFEPIKEIGPNSGMFPAQTAINQLPQIVNSWFQSNVLEIWDVIRDIYLGVQYKGIDVPRFVFLALMQVLEAYHRRKFGGEYLSKEQYEPIRQALIDAIRSDVKSDHRDSLKSRAKYGYQYSQQKRFQLLLEVLGKNIQQALNIEKKDSEYIKRIFATRNYFTHYDEDDAHLVFEWRELDQAISRLTHMVAALLFKLEMGVPEDQLLKILERRFERGHLR